ncbi:MAG: VCBS repeat-containing protein [Candidatus Magnetoovum sp. WYHC-5]|nr:VCBS repeat-containing protein [Candidatus Magnetoovum sp. WYHC-5]
MLGLLFFLLSTAYSAGYDGHWVYPKDVKQWENINGGISTTLAFADMDCDGNKEIIFGTKKGSIFALKTSGKAPHEIKIADSIKTDPLLVDINRDGCTDLIVFGRYAGYDDPADKSVMVVIDGKTTNRIVEIGLNGSIVSKAAAADFNNDGNVDFLVPAKGLFIVDGSFSENKKTTSYNYEIDGITYSSPVIADLNDDAIYDFFIPFSSKGIPYINVFLSTSNYFNYQKLKFNLKKEVKLIPSIVKLKKDMPQKWLLSVPSMGKSIDFYNFIWELSTHSLTLDYVDSFIKYNKVYNNPVPFLLKNDGTPVLPVYFKETGELAILDTLAPNTLSTLSIGSEQEDIAVYTEKLKGDGKSSTILISAVNNILYKVNVEGNEVLELMKVPSVLPSLKKVYLMPYKGKSGQGYAITGITKDNTVYYNGKDIIKDISLKDPNEYGYLNQGAYPLNEIDELIEAMASSAEWRNLSGMDVFLSLAKQLYPDDKNFTEKVKTLEMEKKKNQEIFTDIMAIKASIRQKATSKYDYITLVKWSWYGEIEESIKKISDMDHEFLEEKDIGEFYHKLVSTKDLLRMVMIFALVLGTFTVLVLFILNFRNIVQALIIVLFYFGIHRKWKKVIDAYPEEGGITDYLNKKGFLSKPVTQLFEYKLKVLLLMLLKRNSNEWSNVLTSYKKNMLSIINNKSERMEKRLYKFLLRNYIMLFRKRARMVHFFRWIAFKIQYLFMEDINNFHTKDITLLSIRYEVIKTLFNLNDVRRAFNCLHKLYMEIKLLGFDKTDSSVPVMQPLSVLNDIPQGKIEKYFFKYNRDFFRIVKNTDDRFSILYAYKCMELKPRVNESINAVLKETTRIFGLPIVVINHYLPSSPLIDQRLYYTLHAYNRLKGVQIVMRCIPDKNKFINLANERKLTTLYNNNPTIARIYNNHRNKIWNIQVEAFITHKSLKQLLREGLKTAEIKKIMLSLISILEKNIPIWFIPSFHPAHLFWDGKSVYLTATGLNKLAIDRHIVLNYHKFWENFRLDFFMSPEFYANPDVAGTLSDKHAMEHNIVYLLGLLLYRLLEGGFPYSFESLPSATSFTTLRLTKFSPAQDMVNNMLCRAADRLRVSELKDAVNKIDWID